MKYNLSEQQWRTLWHVKHLEWQNSDYGYDFKCCDQTLSDELNGRIRKFNELYQAQFKLCYNEFEINVQHTKSIQEENHPDYWGYIEGDEKDITLFLLSI